MTMPDHHTLVLQSMCCHLEEQPDDREARLIMADLLEEEGRYCAAEWQRQYADDHRMELYWYDKYGNFWSRDSASWCPNETGSLVMLTKGICSIRALLRLRQRGWYSLRMGTDRCVQFTINRQGCIFRTA